MRFSLTRAGILAGIGFCIAGCSTAVVRHPLPRSLIGNSTPVQGEFWYQLGRQPIASNDEVFHALLLYVDGKDSAADYESRVKELKSRHLLPADFAGRSDEAVNRGTVAVALDQMLHIQGGLTMRIFGPSPRYALRAAVERGILPESSPNQGLSGGEFIGVMQKAEEFEHGDPSRIPASQLPWQSQKTVALNSVLQPELTELQAPADASIASLIYLDTVPTRPPTTAPSKLTHLQAIVSNFEGEFVEIRKTPSSPWEPVKRFMVLQEGTEIRTGPKCSICLTIPKQQSFRLDSQGSMTLEQAVSESLTFKTQIDCHNGRVNADLPPGEINEEGTVHDVLMKAPNSALAIRGTKVSLFEQPSFEPIAVSLTGQAYFTNTDGLIVPFGGHSYVVIVGSQTSPAQQADLRAASMNGNIARTDFEERELAIVSQRGGFQRGDVIVGNLSINDFRTASGALNLPGALDFVLTWTGGAAAALNDLNLGVFSPLNTVKSPDFVANPPFTVSLNPDSPSSVAERKASYPRSSRSGGQISLNSVGPNGLELAFWPKGYTLGNWTAVVYDLVDAKTPPLKTVNPVSYTVNVYQNGANTETYSGTVGELQTQGITFPIAAVPAVGKTSIKTTKISGTSQGTVSISGLRGKR
jgi:hypothetical protein